MVKIVLCFLFCIVIMNQAIYAKEYPEYKPTKDLKREYKLLGCLLSQCLPTIEMRREALIKENIPYLIHIIKNDGNIKSIEVKDIKMETLEISDWKIPENMPEKDKKRAMESKENLGLMLITNAMAYLITLDHYEAVKYIFQKADKYKFNEIFIRHISSIIKKGGCEKEIFEGGILMLKDESPFTNMKSVEVLRELGDEKAIPYLEEYIEKNKNRPELYYKINEEEVKDWIKNDDKQKLQKFYSKERLKIALKEAKEAIGKIKNNSQKKK